MTRSHLSRGELYLPAFGLGHCDLCARFVGELELARVTIEPVSTISVNGKRYHRGDRPVYICRAHPGELAQGPPIVTPREQMARGTSRLRPQRESLFDSLAYQRGSGGR